MKQNIAATTTIIEKLPGTGKIADNISPSPILTKSAPMTQITNSHPEVPEYLYKSRYIILAIVGAVASAVGSGFLILDKFAYQPQMQQYHS